MTEISTHVLDLARGAPAAGIDVTLERAGPSGAYDRLAQGVTNQDGRVATFGDGAHSAGRYRLTFAVEAYQKAQGIDPLFPEVQVVFIVAPDARKYHVPLLLSPFGYSIYRGS